MARKKATDYRYKDVLAKPIDLKTIISWIPKFTEATLEERHRELHASRMEKIIPLARDLGMQVELFDMKSDSGLVSFYAGLVFCLAARHVPGFRVRKSGRWPRELIARVLVRCEKEKIADPTRVDLDVCKDVVKELWPAEYGKKGQGTQAEKAALTLRNRVSALRQEWKRDYAKTLQSADRNADLDAKNVVH